MGLDLSQFHQAFFEECAESLDHMEQALLALDPAGDNAEVINTIFRGAHSIKGGAATFGFDEVARFTHTVETLLDRVRDGSRRITREDIELLLASVDCVRGMLSALRHGEPPDAARSAAIAARLEASMEASPGLRGGTESREEERSGEITDSEFEALLDQLHGPGRGPSSRDPRPPARDSEEITDAEFEALLDRLHGPGRSPSTRDSPVWRIRFKPHPAMLRNGNDPLRIFRELETLGALQARLEPGSLPGFRALDPEACHLSWTLELAGCPERAALDEAFAWVEGECELEITACGASRVAGREEGKTTAPAAAPQATAPAAAAGKAVLVSAPPARDARRATRDAGPEGASIRVSIDKIDALIDLVGELVITQSMLNELSDGFDLSRLPRLLDGLAQLARNTRELQESVMRVRMIPISFAFNRFPRLVHDLSAKLGKKVELRMTGEQTELDKTVMERIADPLVHLVRNALDHGIEAPEVRRARGKPETGTLHLNAYHQSGHIVIEIADDGAGLSRERILRKARERGLVKDEAVLPDDKIHELIFLPGFSTAETVSDVSGRGVGMDVVRKNIKALGGNVEIRSEEGRGTTLTIRLPLTLAILDGQTVRVGEQTYIVPLVSIVESIQARAAMASLVAGQAEVIRLRDEYVPVVRLYELFRTTPRTTRLDEGLLVVVEGEGLKAGLFVDELLGQQQVVIKSLEANYRRVEGVAGATILGDGTVSLILDVPGLIRLSQGRRVEPRQPAPAAASIAA